MNLPYSGWEVCAMGTFLEFLGLNGQESEAGLGGQFA